MSSPEVSSYTQKALAKIERRRRLEAKAENGALKAVHWLLGPKDKEKWVSRGKLAAVATGAYLAVNSCVAVVTNGAEQEFPEASQPVKAKTSLVDVHIDGNTGPFGEGGSFSVRTSPDIKVTFLNGCYGYSTGEAIDLTLPREDVRIVSGDEVGSVADYRVEKVDKYLAFRVPEDGLPSGTFSDQMGQHLLSAVLPGLPNCGPGDIAYVSQFNNISVTPRKSSE